MLRHWADLMCVCEWMECVTVKLNFENRMAYHGESASARVCAWMWCGRWWPNRNMCNGSFVAYSASICEHQLTYHILTMALPHISHNKIHVNSRAHTWTLYIHIKIAPLVWDRAEKNIVPVLASPKATKAQAYINICVRKNKNKTRNKKGITSIENWWMAKYNLFAMFHMFFLCLS